MTQTRGINQTTNRVKESYIHRWWIQSSMRFWKVQQGGHRCTPAQEGSLQPQAPVFVGGLSATSGCWRVSPCVN